MTFSLSLLDAERITIYALSDDGSEIYSKFKDGDDIQGADKEEGDEEGADVVPAFQEMLEGIEDIANRRLPQVQSPTR